MGKRGRLCLYGFVSLIVGLIMTIFISPESGWIFVAVILDTFVPAGFFGWSLATPHDPPDRWDFHLDSVEKKWERGEK